MSQYAGAVDLIYVDVVQREVLHFLSNASVIAAGAVPRPSVVHTVVPAAPINQSINQ